VWQNKVNTHTHTRLTALFPGLPRWASTRQVKPIWILLKQETVTGSSISWAICKSAPRSRQITTPAPHRSVLYRLDALPVAQPTVSKHWRQNKVNMPGKSTINTIQALITQVRCWDSQQISSEKPVKEISTELWSLYPEHPRQMRHCMVPSS